jgi:aminoglycoside 6'-N-acetyltransferase
MSSFQQRKSTSMPTDDAQSEDTERRREECVERSGAQDSVAQELVCLGEAGARAGMILRPLVKEDEAELLRIHATPEVARWWDVPDVGFPWTDEPETIRLTIEVDGAVAGLIQFWEELAPKYRYATIDLFLDPTLHGRGLGTEAVRRLVRHLIDDRGHHRITIDPATTNTAAIRAYEKVGFKPVGVMRRYERPLGGDEWRDGLLMELLAGER